MNAIFYFQLYISEILTLLYRNLFSLHLTSKNVLYIFCILTMITFIQGTGKKIQWGEYFIGTVISDIRPFDHFIPCDSLATSHKNVLHKTLPPLEWIYFTLFDYWVKLDIHLT